MELSILPNLWRGWDVRSGAGARGPGRKAFDGGSLTDAELIWVRKQ